LRLAGGAADTIVDRRAEAANARAAAAAGIGPEVLYADPGGGVLLTRLIDGVTMSGEAFREPGTVTRAALVLRRLHVMGARFAGRLDPLAALTGYATAIEHLGAPLPDGCAAALAETARIGPALAENPPAPAPCHIDPVPENFLDTGGSMYLIDFEYAAMSDAMWDLAYLAVEANLDTVGETALLDAYFDGPAPSAMAARVAVYKPVCDLISVTWAALMAARGHRADAPMADAGARITRCRDALAAPAFRRHLDRVDKA
jgi:thiamine kinase-like enzyme